MRKSLKHEGEALKAYHELHHLVKDKNVRLEEYSHSLIATETAHQDAVNKMLRKPGHIEPAAKPGR